MCFFHVRNIEGQSPSEHTVHYFFSFRLTAMEFLSGFRSNCSFYYLDRGLYFSVLPRRRCQEFTYSELVSVHSYSFLSSPSGSFTELEFLMSKGKELSITLDNTTGPQRT